MIGHRQPAPAPAIVQALAGGATVHDMDLARSYAICRRLNAAHGRTFYFATRFLPADARPHVHALYGFARYADDLVDRLDLGWEPARRREALEAWATTFMTALARGDSDDPVLKAVVRTVEVLGLRHADLRAFLDSMAMDLTVTRYATYQDLQRYVHGSAAVIGAMMLPVLGATHPRARRRAMDLGVAFQLTNFLRDVGEDWDRDRIYLPLEDLDRFGVTEEDFRMGGSPALRALLAFEAARTRALYRRAEQGWTMLHPRSRLCIRIAHRLYAEILDRIERCDYDVFRVRASVPWARKVGVAAKEVLRPTRPSPP